MRTSPLMATAAVVTGIGLMAIPLHRLTANKSAIIPSESGVQTLSEHPSSSSLPSILRLRLLAPAKSIVLSYTSGKVLWESKDIAAGESEFEAAIVLDEEQIDLNVRADFDALDGETALFLTLLPDGMEEKTAWAVGATPLEGSMQFSWHDHDQHLPHQP